MRYLLALVLVASISACGGGGDAYTEPAAQNNAFVGPPMCSASDVCL